MDANARECGVNILIVSDSRSFAVSDLMSMPSAYSPNHQWMIRMFVIKA